MNPNQCLRKFSNLICVEDEPVWGTEVKQNRLRKLLDTGFPEHTKITHPEGDTPLRQYVLQKHTWPNHALEGVQLMSCDYIQGTEGYYMPLESFLSLGNCERMIAKIEFPIPIHLLDHIIIPNNIRDSNWFPAHVNLQTRCISLLDSSYAYSAAAYPQQKMLIWKFFKMAWMTHASTAAPVPFWVIHPERLTSLHPRMTVVFLSTLALVQAYYFLDCVACCCHPIPRIFDMGLLSKVDFPVSQRI